MNDHVLADTGPIVALFSERDSNNAVCVEQLTTIRPPLITSWPVLTEAAWLLRSYKPGFQKILEACHAGFFELPTLEESAFLWIGDFCRRFEKLNPQLADASLVYLAEREGWDTVFTLDRRDFSVYRFRKNRHFRLLP
ncbi:MAG: twitching motility protein PilT [Planctomycetes bacterium]|nr:twitching motility protein PilT [Planctomycetota bacterium]